MGIVGGRARLVAAGWHSLARVWVEALGSGAEQDLLHGRGVEHAELLGDLVADGLVGAGQRGRLVPRSDHQHRDEEDADHERHGARGRVGEEHRAGHQQRQ